MANEPQKIKVALAFLNDGSLQEGEKPYEFHYDRVDQAQRSNFNFEEIQDVVLEDLRSRKGKLSLDDDGFVIADLETAAQYDDFFDEEKLKVQFAEDLRRRLVEILGVRALYFHECVVGWFDHCSMKHVNEYADSQEE
jgi:hypothetical protein